MGRKEKGKQGNGKPKKGKKKDGKKYAIRRKESSENTYGEMKGKGSV